MATTRKTTPGEARRKAGAIIGASGDGIEPWQVTLAGYEVRDGGIYGRTYNIRVATFSRNSFRIQKAIGRALDKAHELFVAEDEALEKLPKVRSKTVTKRGVKYWRAAKEFR